MKSIVIGKKLGKRYMEPPVIFLQLPVNLYLKRKIKVSTRTVLKLKRLLREHVRAWSSLKNERLNQ